MFESSYSFIGIALLLIFIFCVGIIYFVIVSIKNKNREYAYFLLTFFFFSFFFFLSSFFFLDKNYVTKIEMVISIFLAFVNYLLIRKESTLKQIIKKSLKKSLIIILPLGLIMLGIYLS